MKKIELTQGKFALVDDADYERLNQRKWHARQEYHTFYAQSEIYATGAKRTAEYMHRLILGLQPSDKRQCDHRDGNGLNNQQSNLRICTQTQNHQSTRKRTIATSKYKGVCWHQSKWRAQICVNKKRIHLGCFDSEAVAAASYNTAALEHFGEFALLNPL